MQIKGKLSPVLFLLVLVSLVITGCDSDQALDVNPEDVEVVAAEIENNLIQPFDKIRKTEITFEIKGLEEGILKFAADKKIYPEVVEFKDGKAEIDGLLTAREEAKIGVIVKTRNGQQVKELFVDIGDLDKGDFDDNDIILQEQNENKLLGFFVDENYSEEFDQWIYFDNWYIRDFDFFQQFNLVLFLYQTGYPAYYVDEFNNRYATWEEYKVVGAENIEEIDGEFNNFFRNAGYDWDRGFLFYLDAEIGEIKSSFGYKLHPIHDVSVGGHREFFNLEKNLKWKDLIEKLIEDDDFNLEIEISKLGDTELDSEALRDIFEIRRNMDYSDVEFEYNGEFIIIWVNHHGEDGNSENLGAIAGCFFDGPEEIEEGEFLFNQPKYFYRNPDEKEDPYSGEFYDSLIEEDGHYSFTVEYFVDAREENGGTHYHSASLSRERISFSVIQD